MISNETPSRRLKRTFGRLLLSISTLGYSYFVAPFRFALTHTDIPIPHLPAAFDGFRIVAFGDVHYNWRIEAKQIAQVVTMANSAHPDVVCLLGDYVSKQGNLAFPSGLADLRARLGVYAILGNHDFLGRDRIITHQLERVGATVLRNRNVAFERSGQRIWVAGVDDLRSHQSNLQQALAGIPNDEVKILLAHNPDFAARASCIAPPIDLQLSGHTHGGQVKLPLVGPPALPHNHKEWLAGRYNVNGMWLYVNRGTGMSSIAHRLNVRPEVSVITLRKYLVLS